MNIGDLIESNLQPGSFWYQKGIGIIIDFAHSHLCIVLWNNKIITLSPRTIKRIIL